MSTNHTKLEVYDEAELLAYIEGTLDADAAKQLRARLAGDAEVGRLVEAMQRDRSALASEPEPALPEDFAAQLEPQLVRPMLMGPAAASPTPLHRPGEQRRLQQRQRRLRFAKQFAAAAAIALVAGGSLWLAAMQLLPQQHDTVAQQRTTAPPTRESAQQPQQVIAEAWQDPAAIVHHALPTLEPPSLDHYAAATGETPRGTVESPSNLTLLLVVETGDQDAAQAMLVDAAAALSPQVALVQNFNYDEARELEQQWLLAGGDRQPQQDRPVAGEARSRSQQLDELASRAQQQYRDRRANGHHKATSQQLLGDGEHAATFVQQLEFSSRGATHTLTLPVNQLQPLLAALALHSETRTSLHILPPKDVADAETEETANWIDDRAQIQTLLAHLQQDEAAMIHLPIMLQQR